MPEHPAAFTSFKEAVEQAKTVFITAHVGPDGDTLGSMLALRHGFSKVYPHLYGIHCVIAGRMPDVYDFLPGIRDVKDVETAKDLLEQYDLSISVDCGSADRLGPASVHFLKAKTSVNVDHHISNKQFGQINIVIPSAAASGEVVADLLAFLNIPLDSAIATCLYTALMTDTGNFRYSNTSSKAFELAARLVGAGADPEYIYKQVYETMPQAKFGLHNALLAGAEFSCNHQLAWTTVTRSMLDAHQARDEHIEGVVENLRAIDTVLISAVFKETLSGDTKISLRSDSHAIDVAAIMERFQGGGHRMAAGCTLTRPPAQAREVLLPLLEQAIRESVPNAGA